MAPDHRPSSGPKSFALRSLGVVAVYCALAWLGMLPATGQGSVSTFWPPAGIALAAVLLWGWRMVLPVSLASLLVAVSIPGSTWIYCLLAPLGKAAAALAGLGLLRWQGLDNTLERVRDVVDLVVWGGLAACLFSATLGVSGLAVGKAVPWSAWGETWLAWWMGDFMGVLLVAPVVLSWFTRPAITWHPPRLAEAALWLAFFLGILTVVFSGWTTPDTAEALDFLPFPLLFWAALRFGRRLTATASLLVCYAALVAFAMGVGPFADQPTREATLLLWTYLGALSVSALCLAASLGQTRRALRSLAEHRNGLAQAVDRRTVQLVESAQALAESEELYRTLVDESPLGVALIDSEGRYRYLNQSFTDIFGYTLEDVPHGRDWFRHAFPDRRQRHRVITTWEMDQAASSTGQVRPRTFPVACKDGEVKEIFFRPVLLSSGSQLVIYEDVSLRESASRALAQSEEQQRALLKSLQEGVVLIARDGTVLSWNQAATDITGYPAEKVLGTNSFEQGWPLLLPDGTPCPRKMLPSSRAMLGGESLRGELYIYQPRPDRRRWLSANSRALHRPGESQPYAAAISFTDVTESRNALEALKASEEKFRLLADNMADVVWTLDQDRNFTYISPSVERLLGYTVDELRSISPREIMPSDWQDVATQIRHRMNALDQQDPAEAFLVAESLLLAKDGREVMVESVIRQLRNEQGEFIGFTGATRDISERKKAERAMAESEEKFSKIFQHSPIWVVLNTLEEARYLEVNQAFLDQTGWSREEVIGHTSAELNIRPDPDVRGEIIQTIRRSGPVHNREVERRIKNGNVLTMLYSGDIVEIGGQEYLLSLVQDITDRKRTEQALKASEEKFSSVYMTSPAWMALGSLTDYRYLEVNRAFEQITGYSRQEAVGRTPMELGLWPDPENRQALIEKLKQSGKLHQEPVTLRMRSGELRHFLWSAEALQMGDESALISVLLDVTELRQAQQALAESEEQYRLLVSTAQDAIYILQDGKLVFANPEVERTTGFSREHLYGIHFSELLHPDDLELVSRRYQQRLNGQKVPDNYPMRVIGADGKVCWIQSSAVLLTWKGRPAILYVARDITEQRRMEAQLRQSQKLEAVGTLAGGIAHDFNNILAAIMGYAELSLDLTPGGGPVASNLEQVITACKRARDLVSQILSFSRHSEHQLQPLILEPLVREVLGLIRATTPSNIDIITDLEKGGLVLADPVQIHQLLMNLCTNAAQAMEPDGGSIRVGLNRVELAPGDPLTGPTLPPGPYVRLSVADTGPGVPPEIGDRIFEPFFTTKEPGQGSGLGLSAVHGIVQGHQGAVSLEQRPGGGAVLLVLLPEADQALHQPGPEPAPATPGGKERVLFVDDEPPLVEIARNMLARMGYQVSGFTSSQEALAEFQRDPWAYDLVISDQTMPGLTGAALAREIKARRPELPVIICTGFSHQLSPEQAAEIGVSAFVMKPITSAEISRVMRSALDASREAMSDKT